MALRNKGAQKWSKIGKEQKQMTQRFCRKCMIPDYVEDKEEFISVYLDQIPPQDRTEEAVYDSRLKACSICEYYLNGMCRLCGCFVSIRAAHKGQRCPGDFGGTTGRWETG